MYIFKTETFYVVDYSRLERIIDEEFPVLVKQTKYGKEGFNIVADQEWGNDEDHTFVLKKEPLNKWEQKSLDNINKGETENYVLYILMQDLVNRDILPEGNYLIVVSW